jgi:signal transduction histidine kinase/DNA-binding CsgD family transcriptional regulator
LGGQLLKAQEQERARVARDLHEDVTHRLARLAIDVGRAERSTLPPETLALLSDVRQGLSQLGKDVHALAYRLHPSILEDLGLGDALRAECDQLARLHGMSVKVQIRDLPAPVAPDTALCLFRVAQEAVRNVLRHAGARKVHVLLCREGEQLYLAVRDDGVGFDLRRTRTRPGLGHASMLERVRLLDGRLSISSAPGRGTTVRAWVPCREAADSTTPPSPSLTPRQRQILKLLMEGQSAKEIAQNLSISSRTVEFHKYEMMESLGVRNSAALIRFGLAHNAASNS